MERARFIALHEEGLYSMSELYARFGISRKTGYKWWARHQAEGLAGLQGQSRAPRSCAHRTPAKVEAALVRAREAHPHWGPKKLVPYLARTEPGLALPAPSTAGDVLQRHGLVQERKRRRKPTHPGSPPLALDAPNAVWQADFKGEFATGSGRMCYPLTVTEAHSRFLLACHALPSTEYRGAEGVFMRLFATYGLPEAIRTDNGTPFASPAIGGLSRLSVGWIKLGISHQRITPGSHYAPAVRPLPGRVPEPAYPGHCCVRRVGASGSISFCARSLFISEVLAGEHVALEEVEDGVGSLCFYQVLLGRFHERDWQLRG